MSYYSQRQYIEDIGSERLYYDLFFKKGQRIVDIGCSTGNFLAQDPKNILGLDTDEDAIAVAKKRGLKAIRYNASIKLPFKEASIENVHCKHVLEHMDTPLGLMKEIFRVLKKGGRMVLLTDKMTKHFWDDYTHKRPFTETSLQRMVWDAGFKACHIYPFPAQGVFGLGLLYRKNIIPAGTALHAYKAYARLIRGNSIVVDARK